MSVSTLLTEEEFLNLPESPCKQELLDGQLIELPPAKFFHGELAERLKTLLQAVLPKSRVWHEMGYRLRADRWLIPDISVIHPDQPKAGGWLQGSPMLAVEIVSRGNTATDIDKKVAAYLGTAPPKSGSSIRKPAAWSSSGRTAPSGLPAKATTAATCWVSP